MFCWLGVLLLFASLARGNDNFGSYDAEDVWLSIVVVARNDEDGSRIDRFLTHLAGQVSGYSMDTSGSSSADSMLEVIVVEWNPPDGRQRLSTTLDVPDNLRDRLRVISVPKTVQEEMENETGVLAFDYVAKNVGIRRAHGKFVLATDVDVLFSNALVRFMLGMDGSLVEGTAFVIDLHEIADLSGPVSEATLREATRTVRANAVDGLVTAMPADVGTFAVSGQEAVLDIPDPSTYWAAIDAIPQHQNVPQVPETCANVHLINKRGHFLLMDRFSWHIALQGFAELPDVLSVDNLAMVTAAAVGMRQQVLLPPMLAFRTKQTEDAAQVSVEEPCEQHVPRRIRLVVNTDEWGLAGVELDEVRM